MWQCNPPQDEDEDEDTCCWTHLDAAGLVDVLSVHGAPLPRGLMHDALLRTRDLPAPLLPRLRQGSQVRLPFLVVLYLLQKVKEFMRREYKASKDPKNKDGR